MARRTIEVSMTIVTDDDSLDSCDVELAVASCGHGVGTEASVDSWDEEEEERLSIGCHVPGCDARMIIDPYDDIAEDVATAMESKAMAAVIGRGDPDNRDDPLVTAVRENNAGNDDGWEVSSAPGVTHGWLYCPVHALHPIEPIVHGWRTPAAPELPDRLVEAGTRMPIVHGWIPVRPPEL